MARSPNYPKLNLEEAIERVRKVYQAEHTHLTPKEAVAQHLGYKSVNGSSSRLITALKHYGLLEEHDKDRVRVADDAMTILELPRDDPDRMEALRSAAFAPQVFADLQDTYEGNPPSDVSIRHHLLRKKFLPQAANEVIRIYRDNLELVAEQTQEYTKPETVDEQPVEATPVETQQPVSTLARPVVADNPVAVEHEAIAETLQYRISGDSRVRLLFDGRVTQEGIKKLIAYLELGVDDFPTKADLERQPEPIIVVPSETE